MEKLDYWSPVNFLSLLQNTLTYSCLTDTKLHVHVVNCHFVVGANVHKIPMFKIIFQLQAPKCMAMLSVKRGYVGLNDLNSN